MLCQQQHLAMMHLHSSRSSSDWRQAGAAAAARRPLKLASARQSTAAAAAAAASSSSAAPPPAWNPQNRPDPATMPHPDITPQQAVTLQLQAMQTNDSPFENAGVSTMYAFAEDAGSMERSRYFGWSKDLYHLDHFLGALKIYCAAFLDCRSFALLPPGSDAAAGLVPPPLLGPLPDGAEVVCVEVTADRSGAPGGVFEFRLVRHVGGVRDGCWMVKSCTPLKQPDEWAAKK